MCRDGFFSGGVIYLIYMNRSSIKNRIAIPMSPQREVRRDLKAWRALHGIWRTKRIKDPVQWQRKIRKEWERTLP